MQLRTKEVIHTSPEHEQVDSWIVCNNAAKDLMEHMGMDPDIMQPQEKKIDLEI